MSFDILVVDDEADIRELISGILEDEGYRTRLAKDSTEALGAVDQRRPSLVILDIWLQGSRLDGLDVLGQLVKQHKDLPVVIISGHGNIETAVTAIKLGAYDYIEKPFNAERLIHVTKRALETHSLKKENEQLRTKSTESAEIIGNSNLINQLRGQIEKIAPTNSRIMFKGPSGAGKELAARLTHKMSLRGNGPFVVLNGATITPDKMEEELFGIENDNGFVRKVGALEEAHGGTLLLDEVADIPMETQGKILRVLVQQKFQRVNGNRTVEVDVRIMSTTSRDLAKLMAEGKFREDLYHRLNVVPVEIPPLGAWRADIPELIDYFMEQYSKATGRPKRVIAHDAMAVLQTSEWPGNVRQLRNMVERLMIVSEGADDEPITADQLPADIGDQMPLDSKGGEHFMSLPLREAREIFEREYLISQINRFGGNISRTAEFVGMERSALHRKLRALGINSSDRVGRK